MTIQENSLVQALLASAASIGSAAHAEAESNKAKLAKLRTGSSAARKAVDSETVRESGFNTPRFTGLSSVASAFAEFTSRANSAPDSQIARSAADMAANTFVENFTKATAKTKSGGTTSGFAKVIRLGAGAETARTRLQGRIDFHAAEIEAAKADDQMGAAERAKVIADHSRYTMVPGDSLTANGEWPEKGEGEKRTRVKPKFNGRAACTVGGIALPFRGATSRSAQIAAFADLLLTYPDKRSVILSDDFIDSFLDTGGKYRDESDASVGSLAARALDSVAQLIANGGGSSADALGLRMAETLLARLAQTGKFEDSVVAEESAPAEEAPAEEAPAEETPEPPPIVLGEPAAKPATPRKRRGGSV